MQQKIEIKCNKINTKSFSILLSAINRAIREVGMELYVEAEVKPLKATKR